MVLHSLDERKIIPRCISESDRSHLRIRSIRGRPARPESSRTFLLAEDLPAHYQK
jgi:hypothetical protein